MTPKVTLLGFALMAISATATHADALLSRTFYASGPCEGGDRLAALKSTSDETTTQLVEPWEKTPITIVGARIVPLSGTMQYAFAGNSFTPDIMKWLGEAETFYPAGAGFAFPAAGAKAHLDLHYSCLAPLEPSHIRGLWARLRNMFGATEIAPQPTFAAFYTVYYTLAEQRPPKLADAR